MSITHEVLNQAPAMPEFDAYQSDVALVDAIGRYGADWASDRLTSLGRVAGSHRAAELCRLANEKKPELRTHDRWGHRVDEVEFHPSYHELMAIGQEHGVHNFSWVNVGKEGSHVARAALHYLYCQVESSVACPITMTHAAVPSLQHSPELLGQWMPRLEKEAYDPRLIHPDHKAGVTLGMAMTEKQGGSDVRANTTVARESADGTARLTGHKWFCSAPMCDGFLTLAQGDGGLTCYLVPRILPDGGRNVFRIQRLKNKLGNHANASSEIEYDGTWAQRVGEPGRGVATIIEMVGMTRLDVAVGAAAGMREALRFAMHHAKHREAFGKRLIDQPLMRNVLADMAVETEAAVALSFRLARAFDRAEVDEREGAYARGVMSIAKYWLAKRVVGLTFEALECHGGNGYDEGWPMARLYREAPLGSVWEGSGNIQALDLLRAMHKEPQALAVVREELMASAGKDARLDRFLVAIQEELAHPETLQVRARRVIEKLAIGLQAGLLLEHGAPEVAEAFLATRLGGGGYTYGTLPEGVALEAILARA
jgi:putative acyl-CoA dehydrogenase